MHRITNRVRRWILPVTPPLILLLFILNINIYPSNINVIHPFLNLVQNEKRDQPADSFQDAGNERDNGYKVDVSVDLVMMYVSVFNKEGRFVSGLEQKDFSVYEDGVRQEIANFSQIDVPISIGIALDLSGSMESKIDQVNQAARAFIEASNPKDQVFLIGFNDDVELLQGFTSDIDEITDALENAVVLGGTVLYDAIYLGVEEAHKGEKSKKALIVITDGEDKDSVYSLSELVNFVQESDVQIFNIGFIDEIPSKSLFGGWFKSDAEKARDALKRISEESGGEAYFPEEITDIHSIVAEIASELRNQYSIGYFSNNKKRDGTWRRVVVKLDSKAVHSATIRTRRGYYAPKE